MSTRIQEWSFSPSNSGWLSYHWSSFQKCKNTLLHTYWIFLSIIVNGICFVYSQTDVSPVECSCKYSDRHIGQSSWSISQLVIQSKWKACEHFSFFDQQISSFSLYGSKQMVHTLGSLSELVLRSLTNAKPFRKDRMNILSFVISPSWGESSLVSASSTTAFYE